MSTYLQLCKDVRAQSGISGDGPASVTGQTGIEADVVRWVSEAYNEIQSLHENWKFLFEQIDFTLTTGYSSYPALSTHNMRVIAKDSFLAKKSGEDKYRLRYKPWEVWTRDYRFLKSEAGDPEIVTEDPNGNLVFYPVPTEDFTITFEGYHRPFIMVNNTDEPIFHAQYQDLIKLKALMKYSEYYNAMEIYRSADMNFKLLLSKMQFSELPRDNLFTPSFVPFA